MGFVVFVVLTVLAAIALAAAVGVATIARIGARRQLRRLAKPRDDEQALGEGPSGKAILDAGEGATEILAPEARALVVQAGATLTLHRPRGVPRYPIVLAHGILGFDEFGLGATRLHYFRRVPARLRAAGCDVYLTRVSPLGSIELRAQQLAQQIRALPARRVNVVAHSMGGIDARYAISALGLGDRVASLFTIGTPHRGTPIADVGAGLLALDRSDGGRVFGLRLDALRDLTTARMSAFNERVLDAPGVHYGSFVAVAKGGARDVASLLLPSYLFLAHHAVQSDGLVPAESQRWGEVIEEIDVDHWGQVGWSGRFDAGAFYERMLDVLVQRGL